MSRHDDLDKRKEEANEAKTNIDRQHICRVQGEVGVEKARQKREDDEELCGVGVLIAIGAPAQVKPHQLCHEEDAYARHLEAPNVRWEQQSAVAYRYTLSLDHYGRLTFVELDCKEEGHVEDWVVGLKRDKDLQEQAWGGLWDIYRQCRLDLDEGTYL